jgi:hypothetical protein
MDIAPELQCENFGAVSAAVWESRFLPSRLHKRWLQNLSQADIQL